MYSFEGDFRRKPQQNLAGASAQRNNDRDALILQTQQQRQKREEHRKRLHSAVKIQAYVRSFLARSRCKQIERDNFDNIFPKSEVNDDLLLYTLAAKVLFFYDDKKDITRLISISQHLLKHWKRILQNGNSSLQLRRILALHLRLLNTEDASVFLAVPLRMLEVFTSLANAQQCMNPDRALITVGQTILYLVKRGYFQELRHLIDSKTPPLYGPSPNAPTPMCSALLDLIQRPLQLTTLLSAPEYTDIVLSEFTASFFCSVYSDPVEMYVIPALAGDVNQPFPFLTLVQSLSDTTKFSNKNLSNDSWLLHAVLALEPQDFVKDVLSLNNSRLPSNPIILNYLHLLGSLTTNLCNKQVQYDFEDSLYSRETTAERDEDSDSEHEPSPMTLRESALLTRCIELLNDESRCVMTTCAQITDFDLNEEFLKSISEICHNLLLSHKLALQKYRLLYTLAFKPSLLRGLWRWVSGMSHAGAYGGGTALLAALARGMAVDTGTLRVERLLAPLDVFCALFSLLIGTLHDAEFCRDVRVGQPYVPGVAEEEEDGADRVHAFKFSELGVLCRTLRSVCLGLVELACPETRPAAYEPYRDEHIHKEQTPEWSHLFKVCTHLVRALYVRSARLHFCSEAEWTVDGAVAEGALAVSLVSRHQHAQRLSTTLAPDEGPPLTTKEMRTVMILREIPFIVPFSTRVHIFQGVLLKEKHDHWYELSSFNEGPSINISVRRTHLYEDAFDKLRPENEPDMKLKLRVQLINQAGAQEAGVDGGGLFREFLSELLKSAFDPNRGLFRLTKDNMLYPNPGVHLLYDDFPMHYYFVGRMLGKAMYERLLVELPLAEFLLQKLCSARDPDVHALASLDPALYRGLLLLRAHRPRDVPDLGLDFTLLSDELGERRIEELKPGGANIPVTAENRIEYIHLVADYKLNRQIRSQCVALKRGLTSVVSGEWLRMFSCRELQLLISGAEVAIDVDDLRQHTHYSGVFSATHPTMDFFWKALQNFTDDQRRMLLKFVTSCSRPPLLGFKELQPPFCIQSAGAGDRLPSASTCMNLLKLPEFESQEQLSERLLYAIQAGAGFELS